MSRRLQFVCDAPIRLPGRTVRLYQEVYKFSLPHLFIVYRKGREGRLLTTS
jgi:hypothetical protein